MIIATTTWSLPWPHFSKGQDSQRIQVRSVPQHPQALRVTVSDVAPAVDPTARGEQRLAAAQNRPTRANQHLDQPADDADELGALVAEGRLDCRRSRQ